MAKGITDTSNYSDIADAIRDKNGSSDTYKPSEMAAAITAIPSGGGGGIPREVNGSGVYGVPINSFAFSLPTDATSLAIYSLYYALYNCLGVTSVDMHTLTSITTESAMYWAFNGCLALRSVDLRSLTTVSGQNAMNAAFQQCRGLTSVDLSSLTTVSGGQCMGNIFYGCSLLTSIDLSSLTTLSGTNCMVNAFSRTGITSFNFTSLASITGLQALNGAFSYCSNLQSVSFPALTTISSSNALNNAFSNCTSLTSLSFPALTTDSFGTNTNQFTNMLRSVIECTVHFPASVQSIVETMTGYPNFGGTNTTVLFDL